MFEIQEPTIKQPRTIVLFSLPKVGKTQSLSQLPNNLIWDFDGSAGYYKNMRIEIDRTNPQTSYSSFTDAYIKASEYVQKNGKFDFCTIDTITSAYEELANYLGVKDYNQDENKNKPFDWDLTKLPYGLGYAYKRNAIKKIIDAISKLCNILIITGHVGDKTVNKETGSIDVADIDLEGKMKNILAYRVDAIGLFFRQEKNVNAISFVHSNKIAAGTRSDYLRGKTIKISELTDNGLITYWKEIFPSIKQKNK